VNRQLSQSSSSPPSLVADKVLSAFDRFLHVEAVSGIVLLIAAAVALVWANSPAASSYHSLWHTPLSVALGGFAIAQPLEFWINDGLMTIFFLVVGLEIRREMHEGTLASVRVAALPLAAAMGGVVVPALIYLAMAPDSLLREGWAIPTATDIAFAVGVLALLGKYVPSSVRILLLSLAIIDDIAAVIIIAAFYASGLNVLGIAVGLCAVLLVLIMQRLGVRSAYVYLLPGALLWFGLLQSGIHPTLAGVILGLLTPAALLPQRESPGDAVARALREFEDRSHRSQHNVVELIPPLRQLKDTQRELLPPAVRVQMALHPWVAYGVMPLFALANAGVSLEGLDLSDSGARTVAIGVLVALLCGKPLGIFLASWSAVQLGLCRLPPGLDFRGIALVGCLGGIGFTMAIFIATLAFSADRALLSAAKLGVLLASGSAAAIGLLAGGLLLRMPADSRAYNR
jgi:NhaA family Na+:H+ antiporter